MAFKIGDPILFTLPNDTKTIAAEVTEVKGNDIYDVKITDEGGLENVHTDVKLDDKNKMPPEHGKGILMGEKTKPAPLFPSPEGSDKSSEIIAAEKLMNDLERQLVLSESSGDTDMAEIKKKELKNAKDVWEKLKAEAGTALKSSVLNIIARRGFDEPAKPIEAQISDAHMFDVSKPE